MTKPNQLAVIGLGYVGLPLAVQAARQGIPCVGIDMNERVVAGLNSGRSHVDDIEDREISDALEAGFRATTQTEILSECNTAIICVPTPLDEHQAPDLRAVTSAAQMIRDHLHAGMLVVLESTTYPGTTDGLVRNILEESGLRAGIDFSLAFSPERIDPGNESFSLQNTPKIVGGLTPSCTVTACAFYQKIVDQVVPVSGTREAEMAKLLENTYRHVNIALVNEMAIFSRELGVDLWESIDAAATKPFGFTAFYPGPGVGGHCIPIDPNYLSHQVRTLGYQFRFVELAQENSNRMPAYVVTRIQNLLNDQGKAANGARVLLLGLTYKADIADDRETPSRPIIRGLRQLGADVVAHDPYLQHFNVDNTEVNLTPDLLAELERADVVVLLQAHKTYDLAELTSRSSVILDTRGRLKGRNVERL